MLKIFSILHIKAFNESRSLVMLSCKVQRNQVTKFSRVYKKDDKYKKRSDKNMVHNRKIFQYTNPVAL